MNKIIKVLVICFIVLFLLLVIFSDIRKHTKKSDESIEKIDSLNFKVDSIYIIRDSIVKKIDTIYTELEDNNKQYEKNINHVINNDANEDYMFFLNYINSNRARLDSINNNF